MVHLLIWIGGPGGGGGGGGHFIWREWERALNVIVYIFLNSQIKFKRPVLTLVSSRFRNKGEKSCVRTKKKGRTVMDFDCGEGVGYSMRSKYSVLLSVSPMSYMFCK